MIDKPIKIVAMFNNQLHEVLKSQGYSSDEAQREIITMREQTHQGANPFDLLHDNGLESDYIFDLLEF